MIHTLAYQYFKICSDRTKFHEEPNFLKHAFLKNGYHLSFIDKCFKIIINKLVIKRPQATAVKKETLILSLQCLRHILLQTRSKLKSFTRCYKLQTLFKNQRKLANVF